MKNYPLYESKDIALKEVNEDEYNKELKKMYKLRKNDLLTQFTTMQLSTFSEKTWNLSPPKMNELVENLKNVNTDMYITVNITIEHDIKSELSTSKGSNT